MSVVYLTSDWHLGHTNIAKFREGVDSVEQNTDILVDNYKSLVTKRDVVWFLGDIIFSEEHLQTVAELPGTKHLILGNHCTDRRIKVEQLVKVFHSVQGFVRYKKAWLSHCPIHPCELRGRVNIHGHMHQQTVPDSNYINVCVEQTGMTPVSYQKLLEDRR